MIALLFCVMPHKTRELSFHQCLLAGSGAALILVEFSVLQAIWVEKLIAASLTSHASPLKCTEMMLFCQKNSPPAAAMPLGLPAYVFECIWHI